MIISNAKDIPLGQQMNQLPNVNVAMRGWFQPMQIGKVCKQQIDGMTEEIVNYVTAQGVRQPFTAQQLMIKPEGQRAWIWEMFHVDPDLILKPDEIFVYLEVKYRVMQKYDYKEYGYIQYDCVQDFEGCQAAPC